METPMPVRRFLQVDVFSPVPTQGNGLAVVVDAEGLTDDAMQRFAAWTNLAETTFLLPPTDPQADYRVRIFTPGREMPFAGHPTLGSCAAWLHSGGSPRTPGLVRQQCGVGIVPVRAEGMGGFAFDAPPTRVRPMQAAVRDAIVAALSIPPDAIVRAAELDNGPVWQAFELASAADVLALDASRVRWPAFRGIGVVGPQPAGSDTDWEVRMLAPSSGMSEDPITGSLNAAIARWRHAEGRLHGATRVAQGTAIGRTGRVSVVPDGDAVWIGGQVHVLVAGTLCL
jgi:PhzF family phenazine biosynthesis protein